MPLYEYECTSCRSRFDRLVSMSQADQAECPRCGEPDARRLLSVIGGLARSDTGGRAQVSQAECGAGACGACS